MFHEDHKNLVECYKLLGNTGFVDTSPIVLHKPLLISLHPCLWHPLPCASLPVFVLLLTTFCTESSLWQKGRRGRWFFDAWHWGNLALVMELWDRGGSLGALNMPVFSTGFVTWSRFGVKVISNQANGNSRKPWKKISRACQWVLQGENWQAAHYKSLCILPVRQS